jgi:hypothetical protein
MIMSESEQIFTIEEQIRWKKLSSERRIRQALVPKGYHVNDIGLPEGFMNNIRYDIDTGNENIPGTWAMVAHEDFDPGPRGKFLSWINTKLTFPDFRVHGILDSVK